MRPTLHQTALLGGLFTAAALLLMPDPARADRVRWTVQAFSSQASGAVAWDLEARVAGMTYGEMRLKAFAPGELAKPGETFRAVSIGAVGAAVLPQDLLPLEGVSPPDLHRDPIGYFGWLDGGGLDRLRNLTAPRDVHLVPCGLTVGADVEPAFLLVNLPKFRLLERAQVAILEAACDGITLDRMVGAGRAAD